MCLYLYTRAERATARWDGTDSAADEGRRAGLQEAGGGGEARADASRLGLGGRFQNFEMAAIGRARVHFLFWERDIPYRTADGPDRSSNRKWIWNPSGPYFFFYLHEQSELFLLIKRTI